MVRAVALGIGQGAEAARACTGVRGVATRTDIVAIDGHDATSRLDPVHACGVVTLARDPRGVVDLQRHGRGSERAHRGQRQGSGSGTGTVL